MNSIRLRAVLNVLEKKRTLQTLVAVVRYYVFCKRKGFLTITYCEICQHLEIELK